MNIPLGKFSLGQVVITSGALDTLDSCTPELSLIRHVNGDWGEMDVEDKQSNNDALKHGGRLLSVYRDLNKTKFYVITEADRSVTTILLPSEY